MEIYLNVKNLLDDIGGKFLMETKAVEPIPPKGVLVQNINEANGRLYAVCGRFLAPSLELEAGDTLDMAQQICLSFNITARRASGKSQRMADLLHSYFVNSVLTKVYSSMALADLATLHENQTSADANAIQTLLNSKIPPM